MHAPPGAGTVFPLQCNISSKEVYGVSVRGLGAVRTDRSIWIGFHPAEWMTGRQAGFVPGGRRSRLDEGHQLGTKKRVGRLYWNDSSVHVLEKRATMRFQIALGVGDVESCAEDCSQMLTAGRTLIIVDAYTFGERVHQPTPLLPLTLGSADSRRHPRAAGGSRNRLRYRRAAVDARPHPADAANGSTVARHPVP